MKKTNHILLIIFFLTINLIQAQEEKESKFNIIAYAGVGYGILENNNEQNYYTNSNNADILLNYKLNQKFGIATGVGMNELSGNGHNSIGAFSHERRLIKIPFLATMDYSISDNFKALTNLGVYGQYIAKDEYLFINKLQKDMHDDWNYGLQLGLGFVFEILNKFSVGVNYCGQYDFFSKFETIYKQKKMKNLNSFGFILLIES